MTFFTGSIRRTLGGLAAASGVVACAQIAGLSGDYQEGAAGQGGVSGEAAIGVGNAGMSTTGGALATGGTSDGTSAGGAAATAGASAATSGTSAGGTTASGGRSAGGASASGGRSAGGASATGGTSAGGATATAGSGGLTDPQSVGDGDFMVGPSYTPSPDLVLNAGAPPGFSASFTLTSAMSTVFTGSDFTPPLTFSRQIKVFVPQQYVDGKEAPFMVSADGFYAGLQTVVQNLASDPNPDHHVPPLVLIGVQNGPDVQPNSERSLEYDTVSDRYWQFVTKEVLPAVLSNAALKARFPNFMLTSDANGRGAYGCAQGGAAAMGLAWFGDFNRVLSFSGSFVARRPTADHPDGAWDYPQMVADAPSRPNLRVFLEVGQNDTGSTDPGDTNTLTANLNLAAALKAKGNHYRFIEAQGAGPCNINARDQTMPDAMIWLWRGYQAN